MYLWYILLFYDILHIKCAAFLKLIGKSEKHCNKRPQNYENLQHETTESPAGIDDENEVTWITEEEFLQKRIRENETSVKNRDNHLLQIPELKNFGVNCYINSALLILFSCQNFRQWMSQIKDYSERFQILIILERIFSKDFFYKQETLNPLTFLERKVEKMIQNRILSRLLVQLIMILNETNTKMTIKEDLCSPTEQFSFYKFCDSGEFMITLL
ncbi:hypothetical protein M153_12150002509, partial [Pseudoloma neurophilia]